MITLEELKERLNIESPVELVCTDGYYKDCYKNVNVFKIESEKILISDALSRKEWVDVLPCKFLDHLSFRYASTQKLTKQQCDQLRELNEALEKGQAPAYVMSAITEANLSEVARIKANMGLENAVSSGPEKPKMGGGLRYNSGKAQLHLVPSSINFAIAKTLEFGGQKYALNNWRNGMSWVGVYNCLQRHLQKWNDGEAVDEESLLPHLYHAACNLAFLIEYAETFPEGDDRFKGVVNQAKDSFDKIKFAEYKKPENK